MECSATTGEGVREALEWLASALEKKVKSVLCACVCVCVRDL